MRTNRNEIIYETLKEKSAGSVTNNRGNHVIYKKSDIIIRITINRFKQGLKSEKRLQRQQPNADNSEE